MEAALAAPAAARKISTARLSMTSMLEGGRKEGVVRPLKEREQRNERDKAEKS